MTSHIFATRTKGFLCLAISLISVVTSSFAQKIPEELWGKWVVHRELPTTTISCWGEREAQKIMGTEIEYSAEVFRWKDVITRNPIVIPTIIGAEQFHDQNSGRGTNSSQVTFKQLGIKAAEAKRIVIQHSVGSVAEATTEIPGDDVLVKDHNTIIFSMCNLFFEAKRAAISPHKK